MSALVVGPHQAALKDELRVLFASRNARGLGSLRGVSTTVVSSPCWNRVELSGDEHIRARAASSSKSIRLGAVSARLENPMTAPGVCHGPPPRRGEHTDAILREAGIDEGRETIATLRAEGAAR